MKAYLDLCCWQRPFDDRGHPRVAAESAAILGIISLFETKKLELVSSVTLELELSLCPDEERRRNIEIVLNEISLSIPKSDIVHVRANELHALGLQPVEALHLASAEAGNVDVFCTCDDRLLKRARSIGDLKLRVLSPLELANEVLP